MNFVGCLGFAIIMFIAFKFGGWPLAIGVLVLLGWLANKYGSKETTEIEKEADLVAVRAQADDDPEATGVSDLEQDWPPELVAACSALSAKKYHIGSYIPSNLLEKARSAYPPSGDGRILAIIDSSIFGSGKTGMAIGLDGLAWKSPFKAPEKISWKQLSGALIEKMNENEIKIRQSSFNYTGSEIDSDDMVHFLKSLKKYAQESAKQQRHSELSKPLAQPETGITRRPAAAERSPNPVRVNQASLDELLELPGIGVVEAKLIINRRTENPFLSSDELVEFLGLKPHLAGKLLGATYFAVESAGSKEQVSPPSSPDDAESKVKPLRGRMID